MSDHMELTAGWHADRHDPMTARYWNGRTWTGQRRWSGTEWVDVPLAVPAGAEAVPTPPDRPTGAATSGGQQAAAIAGHIGVALKRTSTTFKVFVGAAIACVLGYFVPAAIVTSGAGYSESRSLTDAGGFGVLVLAAAAATVWLAWPTRDGGIVSQRALWGLGGVVAIVALFAIGVISALGSQTEDLVIMTASKSVDPSLGLVFLVGAVAAQVTGILLAVRDRRQRTR